MKVSIVGAGNAGCITALYFSYYGLDKNIEVELIHDPNIKPVDVGQATLLGMPRLLWDALEFNWYDNPIYGTFKTGILYEGWGKKNDKIMHDFSPERTAMHYCPAEMQRFVLESGRFKVTESNILEPKNVDGDIVFDCRGKPDDFSNYDQLINPTNACLLGKPNWNTVEALWSRHVATPDGWTFVIPTHPQSPSHDYCVGYCYNSSITSREDAEKNMLEMFDVEITNHLNYKNYVAKNPVIDDRIVLNGNRLFFLEPMESSSNQTYLAAAEYIFNDGSPDLIGFGDKFKEYVTRCQNFILYHYAFGSKYDTPFWEYAKRLSLRRTRDEMWDMIIKDCMYLNRDEIQLLQDKPEHDITYAQWGYYNINLWYRGVNFHNPKRFGRSA